MSRIFKTLILGLLTAWLMVPALAAGGRSSDSTTMRSDSGMRRFTAMTEEEKDCLCHLPPGNPARAQTICVGGRAATAHLRHGDTEGACDATQNEQTCDDGIDNDMDGLTDCQDPDCVGEPGPDPLALRSSPFSSTLWGNSQDMLADGRRSALFDREADSGLCEQPEASCDDAFDNDGDGLSDCDDADCAMAPACDGPQDEICNDGVDNDMDQLVDCQDDECIGSTGAAGEVCQQPESDCGDTYDNDGDLRIDCDDSDCALDDLCDNPEVEICDDSVDNDGDGRVDCQDAECSGQTGASGEVCQQPELSCADGFDNDGDLDFDCDDSDCSGATNCQDPTTEVCNDQVDNDQDGLIDCADPECIGQDGSGGICQDTETFCDDDFDNDADGSSDCGDLDCTGTPACDGFAEICNDGFDNDFDGDVDCDDADCETDEACLPV